MILIMLLFLVHLFLHRLFMTWAGDGSSTFLSFLVAFNVPTSGSTPAHPYTPIFSCLPLWYPWCCVGWGKNILPCSAGYKIRVYRFEDETQELSCRGRYSDSSAWDLDQDSAWPGVIFAYFGLLSYGSDCGVCRKASFWGNGSLMYTVYTGFWKWYFKHPICRSSTAIIPFPLSHFK